MHTWIGNLLLASGCYPDAYRAYAEVKQPSGEVTVSKVIALVKLGQFCKARKELAQEQPGYRADLAILRVLCKMVGQPEESWDSLHRELEGQEGETAIFSELEYYQVASFCLFIEEKYAQALAEMRKARAYAVMEEGKADPSEATVGVIDRNIRIMRWASEEAAFSGEFLRVGEESLSRKFLAVLVRARRKKVRLSFGVGKMKMPKIYPFLLQSLVLESTPEGSERRPEAPWIRRGETGVTFTNHIMAQAETIHFEDEP